MNIQDKKEYGNFFESLESWVRNFMVTRFARK